jgi:NADP-dependent 3-hydroxy acid dehydrogenase YdfG
MEAFSHTLVFGAGSSIASHVLGEIKEYSESLIHVYRELQNVSFECEHPEVQKTQFDFDDTLEDFDEFISNLGIESTDSLLILNFIGKFGVVETIDSISPESILKTMEQNLLPFLKLVKLLKGAGRGSLMIGFSGAGIGGSNLERTSLGYLGGKGAMGFICEAISGELQKQAKSISLIAPGPFPSRMQEIVAQSTFPEFGENRKKSSQVMQSVVSPEKLNRLIKWIIKNPKIANGRILSALHDDPASVVASMDYGFLRRVY